MNYRRKTPQSTLVDLKSLDSILELLLLLFLFLNRAILTL